MTRPPEAMRCPAPIQPDRRKLQGLLLFRLVLAVVFLALTLIVQSRKADSLLAARLQPLYVFSAILFAYTIFASLALNQVHNLRGFAYQQLFFDVAAITVLIYLSGGVDSLFSFLYLPVITAAAILLYRRGSLMVASVAAVCYGLLLDLQYFGWIRPLYLTPGLSGSNDSAAYFYGLIMNWTVFFLTATVTGYLAEELLRSRRQVARQQEDLFRIEALHQNIVNSMTSGLLTLNRKGVIIFANPAAGQILGIDYRQLIGSPISAFFPNISQWIDAPSKTPEPLPGRQEVLYSPPDAAPIWLGYTISALRLEQATSPAAGWVLIFQDLTQLKQMERELRRQEKLAFAGRVAAEIVHEIKNPLASMSGAVELLANEDGDHLLRERLMSIVSREIDRVNQLVTNFLWLAKGTQTLKPGPVSLVETVEEVLEMVKTHESWHQGHRIDFQVKTAPLLWMDADHLRQIVWNLVINGLEAMADGGLLSVRIDTVQASDHAGVEALLIIRDQGTGVPPEQKDRIFEPFFTTKDKGTGLGLSIVYQLLRQAGARLQVHSVPGTGTTIETFFPITCILTLAKPA